MKKIDNLLLIAGVIVVLGGVGLVFLSNLVSPEKETLLPTPKPIAVRVSEFTDLMRNSEVEAPDIAGKIKLADGKGEFPGGSVLLVSNVGMTEIAINNYDVFGSLAVNYGGSGSFVYVGLFNTNEESLVFKSMTPPLGDRIIIKSATASAFKSPNYTLTVSYLDRKPTEPMASPPTVLQTATFQVKDHKIQ